MRRPLLSPTLFALLTVSAACAASATGCKSVTRFSSKDGDHFEGDVVKGNFVRSGLAEDARMCVTLDASRLQDSPGILSTSDGRFKATPLRPIPQIWHDPLSTLSFGEGRVQNLVYVATPAGPATDTQDVMVFMSLMDEGGIEVRIVRGAPQVDGGAPASGESAPVFGVFTLDRRDGPCSF
jgi:hypothetical protein